MIITQETTVKALLARYLELGYYLPYGRIQNHIMYTVASEAATKARQAGLVDARSYFVRCREALKNQERDMFTMARGYGEV